ncbi:hypothetical protein G7Y89_g2665 [Cudoniella acicularis]|uniref:Uncharacterized protein n=1 Tax=Cudoniella acicularis TaxID=354080 RepID=A0A8H4RUP0_9HELO|nr:hypothetical protein G7Y89_g2665 [Cudoniella acicularis]
MGQPVQEAVAKHSSSNVREARSSDDRWHYICENCIDRMRTPTKEQRKKYNGLCCADGLELWEHAHMEINRPPPQIQRSTSPPTQWIHKCGSCIVNRRQPGPGNKGQFCCENGYREWQSSHLGLHPTIRADYVLPHSIHTGVDFNSEGITYPLQPRRAVQQTQPEQQRGQRVPNHNKPLPPPPAERIRRAPRTPRPRSSTERAKEGATAAQERYRQEKLYESFQPSLGYDLSPTQRRNSIERSRENGAAAAQRYGWQWQRYEQTTDLDAALINGLHGIPGEDPRMFSEASPEPQQQTFRTQAPALARTLARTPVRTPARAPIRAPTPAHGPSHNDFQVYQEPRIDWRRWEGMPQTNHGRYPGPNTPDEEPIPAEPLHLRQGEIERPTYWNRGMLPDENGVSPLTSPFDRSRIFSPVTEMSSEDDTESSSDSIVENVLSSLDGQINEAIDSWSPVSSTRHSRDR